MSSLTRRCEYEDHGDGLWSSDEELGQLVRWSLATSVGNAEPPPEVWHTILERVQEQRTPGSAQCTPRCSSAPLAALVQAGVIGCMLMTLGFGMRRDVIIARNSLAAKVAPHVETQVVADPIPAKAPAGSVPTRVDEECPWRLGGVIREATLPG